MRSETKFPFQLNQKAQDAVASLAADCIACGACTRHCRFLEKYGLDLREFAQRPELYYSCFLCGRCDEVCPRQISGRAIAVSGRSALLADDADNAKEVKRTYRFLLWEKDPYRFAAYQKSKTVSVLWTGCNFTGFFPKTEERLRKLFAAHGIGVIYDCCGKPVSELGFSGDAERNLAKIGRKLLENGVRELIMVCPNCYYYMRDKLPEGISCVTVYRKLRELGIGNVLRNVSVGNTYIRNSLGKSGAVSADDGQFSDCQPNVERGGQLSDNRSNADADSRFPLYLPCPDRAERVFYQDLLPFLPEYAETKTYREIPCCGLGGCAAVREAELARGMAAQAKDMGGGLPLFTYCASCVSQFRRNGFCGAQHVLPLILGVEENLPGGIRPFLNRAAKKL